MCGIAGLLYTDNRKRIDPNWLESLGSSLQHRGPDDFGFLGWNDSKGAVVASSAAMLDGIRAAFIHRRLSIIDTSKSGWQPMQTNDGVYSIVLNGEIYNYLELRAELEMEGYVFHSHSDTEVLLKGYAQWGKSVLPRLIGMFAFAVLDLKRRCLFLARDPFGIKPLYCYVGEDIFGFASETTTLLQYPGISRRVNAARLYNYLRFDITDYGDETFWADIHQIPAANYLEIQLDGNYTFSPQHYWQIPPYQPLDISYDEATKRLRDLFVDSVRLHLRSDVSVGACLSGGIDSSSIVMVMREVLGAAGEINTFSYIPTDAQVSEEHWMNIVVSQAATRTQNTRPNAFDLVESLPDLIRSQGEPFGSTSIFAQYKVFELASQAGIKVMLDGQGADEILGGYWAFISARIASHLAQGHWVEAVQLYRHSCTSLGISRRNLLSMAIGLQLPPILQTIGYGLIGRDLRPAWMNNQWFHDRDVLQSPMWKVDGRNHMHSQLVDSLQRLTLPKLLRYEDRNSMRFSIESRVPFLTIPIVEFIYALPEQYIIDQSGITKAVFRSAMRGLVPDTILDRRDKIGFTTPESSWFETLAPWIEQRLKSEDARKIPVFDLRNLENVWQSILSGRRSWGTAIWRLINLIEWANIFNADFDA